MLVKQEQVINGEIGEKRAEGQTLKRNLAKMKPMDHGPLHLGGRH